jgi:hypothetical protein
MGHVVQGDGAGVVDSEAVEDARQVFAKCRGRMERLIEGYSLR